MSVPQYQVDDIVYLIESAKVGFIESYRISGVRQNEAGVWMYLVAVSPRSTAGSTYGDRITLQQNLDFELVESELCAYCDAVNLALAAVQANVSRLQALKSAHCEESGSGT